MNRTIEIIQNHGIILLKNNDGFYLGCCNIAGGPDQAHWVWRPEAMSFSDMKWAFAIAKLYKAKVVVFYPRRENKGFPTCRSCGYDKHGGRNV